MCLINIVLTAIKRNAPQKIGVMPLKLSNINLYGIAWAPEKVMWYPMGPNMNAYTKAFVSLKNN